MEDDLGIEAKTSSEKSTQGYDALKEKGLKSGNPNTNPLSLFLGDEVGNVRSEDSPLILPTRALPYQSAGYIRRKAGGFVWLNSLWSGVGSPLSPPIVMIGPPYFSGGESIASIPQITTLSEAVLLSGKIPLDVALSSVSLCCTLVMSTKIGLRISQALAGRNGSENSVTRNETMEMEREESSDSSDSSSDEESDKGSAQKITTSKPPTLQNTLRHIWADYDEISSACFSILLGSCGVLSKLMLLSCERWILEGVAIPLYLKTLLPIFSLFSELISEISLAVPSADALKNYTECRLDSGRSGLEKIIDQVRETLTGSTVPDMIALEAVLKKLRRS